MLIKDEKNMYLTKSLPSIHQLMRDFFSPQCHLKMCKDLYRQRNAMYACYQDLLNREVQKQRIQIPMSDFRVKQNLEQQKKEKGVKLRGMRMLGGGGNIAGSQYLLLLIRLVCSLGRSTCFLLLEFNGFFSS